MIGKLVIGTRGIGTRVFGRFLWVVLLGVAACQSVASPDEPLVVPVEQEPMHKLVLERGGVQILDVRIQPGDTSLFHLHDAPFFYVSLDLAPTDAQLVPGGPWTGPPPILSGSQKPGDVATNIDYLRQPVTHRVTNIGANVFRLVGVNHRGAGADLTPGEPPLPGAKGVENRWFRSSRLELAAGAGSDAFRLQHPPLIVLVGAGTVEVTGGSGAPRRLAAHGDWFFGDAGTEYRVRNVGNGAALVIVAETR